jgi:PII-like signaling protein
LTDVGDVVLGVDGAVVEDGVVHVCKQMGVSGATVLF